MAIDGVAAAAAGGYGGSGRQRCRGLVESWDSYRRSRGFSVRSRGGAVVLTK